MTLLHVVAVISLVQIGLEEASKAGRRERNSNLEIETL